MRSLVVPDSTALDTGSAPASDDVRARIVEAAAALIAAGGRDAATTRAISAAAAVQAPTIYRLFGDKRSLLDAVAEHGMATYIAQKSARVPDPDPLRDLRDGWDMHVEFGLANPGLFAIMSGEPDARPASPAIAAGLKVLQHRIRRIALAGCLRVSEERALFLIQSVCIGTVLTLLGEPAQARDVSLSVMAREAVMAAITGEVAVSAETGPRGAAMALRASLDDAPARAVLTSGERHLLAELLLRITDAA